MSETYVERTCTRLDALESGRQQAVVSAPLSSFRSEHAYVLLGDAGAGKSTEFRQEREELGDGAVLRSARDFVTLDVKSEWSDKTVFIDGLDEIRAVASDGRPALDDIRKRLEQLDWPKYRISCREADWLGSNDRRSLETETPGGAVAVLRLDPLDLQAKRALVAAYPEIDDTSAFFDEVEQRGLGGMSDNPLTLELLAGAFAQGGGTWPASRLETFELACERMVREHNDEHNAAAVSDGFAAEDRLAAAGELCALTLLSGAESISLAHDDDGSQCIVLNELRPMDAGGATGNSSLRRHALRTKLFSAANGPKSIAERPRVSPIHRQIAEFLGGRYLAGLVKSGLPARRIVALMISPHDGRVVTSLRGLSAWLSAHSVEALDRLIDADPVGIGLYGDISGLGGERKQRLLRALASYATASPLLGHQWRDDPDAGYRDSTAWAFRSIVDAETVEVVAELLHGQADDPASDRIAAFLLRVLTEAEGLSKVAASRLATVALGIARKQQWSADTRRAGLEAFMSLETDRDARDEALAALLTDIAEGRLVDPDDDLAGLTLRELYPHRVRPAEIWSYLEIRTRENYHGAFDSFWSHAIVEQSSAHDAADALDALWAVLPHQSLRFGVDEVLHRRAQDMMPVELLVKALEELGDHADVARLFGWLAVAATCGRDIQPDARQGRHEALSDAWEHLSPQEIEQLGYPRGEDQAAVAQYVDPAGPVRAWLEQRPETQRHLYLEWLKTRHGDGLYGYRAWLLPMPLFFSALPRDLGRWCLEQALGLEASDPDLATDILGHIVRSLVSDSAVNDGLTLDDVRERAEANPRLTAELERLLSPPPQTAERVAFEAEIEELDRENRRKEQELRQQWADHVRDSLPALSDGSFPVHHLHDLAYIYFGRRHGSDRDVSGRERLTEFLQDDGRLAGEVIDALAAVALHAELPTVDETLSLCAESKHAWVAWPLFAGLHIVECNDVESPDAARAGECHHAGEAEIQVADCHGVVCQSMLLDSLDDERKRRVIATYLCVLNPLDRPAPWLKRWLEAESELVSDVLIRCAVDDVRTGRESSTALNELNVLGFDELTTHRIRLRVLKSFPTAAPRRQLSLLDSLLFALIAEGRTEGARDLFDAKLATKSLTVAQRARWLATAVFLFQGQYVGQLSKFAARHSSGTRCLAEFLHHSPGPRWGRESHLAARFEPATLEMLIKVLGGAFAPFDLFDGAYTVTAEIRAAEWVENLLFLLSRTSSAAATDALRRLEQSPELAAWREPLRRAREDQAVERRNTEYHPPTVDEVQRVLGGEAPANAADLAALLLDRLDDIADETRGSPADPWRPFWNEDTYGRPDTPKPENSCRDSLLMTLRARLPSEVDVVREGSYAADKRADIRVSCGGFNVPIEIKRESHSDLWHAMRTQLVGQYTTDPATDGYGTYLVLWFGGGRMPTPPSGQRPTTPDELREHLEQHLSIDEARKISVRVLDLTKPGAA